MGRLSVAVTSGLNSMMMVSESASKQLSMYMYSCQINFHLSASGKNLAKLHERHRFREEFSVYHNSCDFSVFFIYHPINDA